jgi:hypothetical protein
MEVCRVSSMRSSSPMRVEQSLDDEAPWVGRESADPDGALSTPAETGSQAVSSPN